MKNYSQFTEEGLRIVDEFGVSFESEEENEAIHQEMLDLNINHAEELAMERWFREEKEPEDAQLGIIHPYGNPYWSKRQLFLTEIQDLCDFG